jgi:hypothetical protein
MDKIADSIAVKRLVRNLRYRLTYVQILEAFLEPTPGPEVVRLLQSLMEAQQSAAASLRSYLCSVDVHVQDLSPDQRLLEYAANRQGIGSRLRFLHYGLGKAASWYRMQLTDKQMTADPELRNLLFELGQMEAAKLWRVEAVMTMLRMPLEPEPEDQRELRRFRTPEPQDWRPGLAEDVGRPAWKGRKSTNPFRPSRSSHNR